MDPNETLAMLREWAMSENYAPAGHGEEEQARELFQAIDEWLSKGGFLPEDWVKPHDNDHDW